MGRRPHALPRAYWRLRRGQGVVFGPALAHHPTAKPAIIQRGMPEFQATLPMARSPHMAPSQVSKRIGFGPIGAHRNKRGQLWAARFRTRGKSQLHAARVPSQSPTSRTYAPQAIRPGRKQPQFHHVPRPRGNRAGDLAGPRFHALPPRLGPRPSPDACPQAAGPANRPTGYMRQKGAARFPRATQAAKPGDRRKGANKQGN